MELNSDNHVQATTCQHLFEHALGMPGILHIFANAAKVVDKALQGWEFCFKVLSSKTIDNFS